MNKKDNQSQSVGNMLGVNQLQPKKSNLKVATGSSPSVVLEPQIRTQQKQQQQTDYVSSNNDRPSNESGATPRLSVVEEETTAAESNETKEQSELLLTAQQHQAICVQEDAGDSEEEESSKSVSSTNDDSSNTRSALALAFRMTEVVAFRGEDNQKEVSTSPDDPYSTFNILDNEDRHKQKYQILSHIKHKIETIPSTEYHHVKESLDQTDKENRAPSSNEAMDTKKTSTSVGGGGLAPLLANNGQDVSVSLENAKSTGAADHARSSHERDSTVTSTVDHGLSSISSPPLTAEKANSLAPKTSFSVSEPSFTENMGIWVESASSASSSPSAAAASSNQENELVPNGSSSTQNSDDEGDDGREDDDDDDDDDGEEIAQEDSAGEGEGIITNVVSLAPTRVAERDDSIRYFTQDVMISRSELHSEEPFSPLGNGDRNAASPPAKNDEELFIDSSSQLESNRGGVGVELTSAPSPVSVASKKADTPVVMKEKEEVGTSVIGSTVEEEIANTSDLNDLPLSTGSPPNKATVGQSQCNLESQLVPNGSMEEDATGETALALDEGDGMIGSTRCLGMSCCIIL